VNDVASSIDFLDDLFEEPRSQQEIDPMSFGRVGQDVHDGSTYLISTKVPWMNFI